MSSTADPEPTAPAEKPTLEPISTSTEHTDSLSVEISENSSKIQHAKSIGTTTPEVEGEEQEPIAAVEEYPTTPLSAVDSKSDHLLRLVETPEPKEEEAPLPPQSALSDKVEDNLKEAEETALPQQSHLESVQLNSVPESQPMVGLSAETKAEQLPREEQPTSEVEKPPLRQDEETLGVAETTDESPSDDTKSNQVEENVDQGETPLADKEESSELNTLEETEQEKPTSEPQPASESKSEVLESAATENMKPLEEETLRAEVLDDTSKPVSEDTKTYDSDKPEEEALKAPALQLLEESGLKGVVLESKKDDATPGSDLGESAAVLPSEKDEDEGDLRVGVGSEVGLIEDDAPREEGVTVEEVSPATEATAEVPELSELEFEPATELAKTESKPDAVEETQPTLDEEITEESQILPVEEVPNATETSEVPKEDTRPEETHQQAASVAAPPETPENALEASNEATEATDVALVVQESTISDKAPVEEEKPTTEVTPVVDEAGKVGIVDEDTEPVSGVNSEEVTTVESEEEAVEEAQNIEEKPTVEGDPVTERPALEETSVTEESVAIGEASTGLDTEDMTAVEAQDIGEKPIFEVPVVIDESSVVGEAPMFEVGAKTEKVEDLVSEPSNMEKSIEDESLATQESSAAEEPAVIGQTLALEKEPAADPSVGEATSAEETLIIEDAPEVHESSVHEEGSVVEEIDEEAPVEGAAVAEEKAVIEELSAIEDSINVGQELVAGEQPVIEAFEEKAAADDEVAVSSSKLKEAVIAEPVFDLTATNEMHEQPQAENAATTMGQSLDETEETSAPIANDQSTTPAPMVDSKDESSGGLENMESVEVVKGEAPLDDVETMTEPSTAETISEVSIAGPILEPTAATEQPSPEKSEALETKHEPPLGDLAVVTGEPFEAESKTEDIVQPIEETQDIKEEEVEKESTMDEVSTVEEAPVVEERPVVENTTIDEDLSVTEGTPATDAFPTIEGSTVEEASTTEKYLETKEPAGVEGVSATEGAVAVEEESDVKDVPAVEEIIDIPEVLTIEGKPVEGETQKETVPAEDSGVRVNESLDSPENALAAKESEERQAAAAMQVQVKEFGAEEVEEVPVYETSAVVDSAEQPVEVPQVVVELTAENQPSHGDDLGPGATPGQREAFEKRRADAEPDQLIIVEEPPTPEILPTEEATAKAIPAVAEEEIASEPLQKELTETEQKAEGLAGGDHEINLEQIPTAEKALEEEETPVQEVLAVATIAVQEAPAAEHAIAVEETPSVEEEAPTAEENLVAEQATVIDEAPAPEVPTVGGTHIIRKEPATEGVSAAEEKILPVGISHAAEEVPGVDDDGVIINHGDAKPEDVAEAEAAVKVSSPEDDKPEDIATAVESVLSASEEAAVITEFPQSSEEPEERQTEVPVNCEESQKVPTGATSVEGQVEDLSQEVSINPLPASETPGNPIDLAPGEKVPEIGASSIDSNVKLDPESYEKADASNFGVKHETEPEEILSVKPLPASETAGNPIELQPGEPVPDLGSASIGSNVKLDQESYEKADASNFGIKPEVESEVFSVNPLPASETAGNPIELQPGEPVPELGSTSIGSNVKLDQESYERADASNFGVKSFDNAKLEGELNFQDDKGSTPALEPVDTIESSAGSAKEDDAEETPGENDTPSITAKDSSEPPEVTVGGGADIDIRLEESAPTEINKVEPGVFVDKSAGEVIAPVEPDSNASIITASVLGGVAALGGGAAIIAVSSKDKPSSLETIASSKSTEDVEEQVVTKLVDEDCIIEPAPQTTPSPVHGIIIPEEDVKQAVANADTSSAPAIVVSSPPTSPTVGSHQESERTVEIIEPTPEGSTPRIVEQESENTSVGVKRRLDGSHSVSRPVSSGNDTISTKQHKNVMRAFWNVLFLNWFGGLFGRMFGKKKSRATSG